mgnify:CR=1 FL=1
MNKSIKTNQSFKETTGKRLTNTSQLKLFDLLQDLQDNEKFINIFKSYIVSESNFDDERYYEIHEVDHSDWLDEISYKYYETDNLWWLIAMTNNIVNPFEDVSEGDFLRILKPEYLYKILKEIETIGDL